MTGPRLTGVPCPACGSRADVVVDSRPASIGDMGTVRRRRVCPGCGARFNTAELPLDLVLGLLALRDQSPTETGETLLRELIDLAALVAQLVKRKGALERAVMGKGGEGQ